MYMEQHIVKFICQSKNIIKMNITMTLLNNREQLYLETEELNVGLGVSVLQGKGNTLFPRNKEPDNALLLSVVFAK